ncbi:MAG: hypothetical protein Q8O13_05730 [Candidatus Omnitrophota bacterium]|nr:hypothetical protein [Candidatus Omnitrophota bacterium]
MFKRITQQKIFKFLTFTASFWFIFVCAAHLFSLRPLWGDEEAVLYNLKNLSGKALFGPLLAGQVFPRLYLLLIHWIAGVFNYHLLSLKILPFIFMISGYFVWLKIYQHEKLLDLQCVLIALSWSASRYLVYYSAELKQYSCDVFVAAIFTLFLYKQKQLLNERSITNWERFSIFLPILLLFSYTGFLFVWIPLYNIILAIKDNKKNLYLGICYLSSLILFAFLVYYFDIRFYTGYVHAYWRDYFLPLDSFYEFLKSFTEGINNLMSCWFAEVKFIKCIARLFAVFGLYSIFHFFVLSFRKKIFKIHSVDTLTFVLFVELMLLGILKIYPFTGERVTLFFAPFVLLAIIKGIYLLRKVNPALFTTVLSTYGIFLFSVAVFHLREFCLLFYKLIIK